ncbi:MAG: sigma-54-dependent transcriptional regulator [Myxococcota bacterium]
MKRVLVIEDDRNIRENLLELLEAEGFEVVGAPDGKAGVGAALARVPDVIVCDITMPVMDGHQVLRAIRDYPETAAVPFIFLTARAQRADVREGMRLGADDYLTKPFSRLELLDAVRSRLRRAEALGREVAPSPAAPSPGGPVVASPALRRVYEQAMIVARSDLSILLLGETGVGKDVLAHAIHKESARAGKPFVPLNCAALPENLLETELFGHEKGAFTGADAMRKGLFEAAAGGTVFLDEVGDLPRTTQVKLLRVLEDRRVMRVGGRSFVDVDVRFVSATNRDLRTDCDTGAFRRDLYFRIGGLVLTVPPLRERREEIPLLADRFAGAFARHLGRRPPAIAPEALAMLGAYPWPGNVRELRNVVERAVALCGGGDVGAEHFADSLRVPPPDPGAGLQEQLKSIERQRIVDALERHAGNQTRAAEELGISRRTLLHRLDEFGLPRPRKDVP